MSRNIVHVRESTIVALLARTGIRAGDLGTLDFDDVNFENRELKVNKRIGNYFDLTIAGCKKNKVESMIPLDDEILKVLMVYLVSAIHLGSVKQDVPCRHL